LIGWMSNTHWKMRNTLKILVGKI